MIIVGDVHGEFDKLKAAIKYHKINNQILIQVGDFGLGFNSFKEDLDSLALLNTLLQRTVSIMYIIRGNHDNKVFWEQSDILDFSNIKLVKDYTVLPIENEKILFIGGGISPNRIMLKQDINYWKDEYVVTDQNRLSEFTDVDIIITHVAPIKFWPHEHSYMTTQFILKEQKIGRTLNTELWEERKFMDRILFSYQPHHWFYGHYHDDKVESICADDGHKTKAVCVGKLSFFDYQAGEFLDSHKQTRD